MVGWLQMRKSACYWRTSSQDKRLRETKKPVKVVAETEEKKDTVTLDDIDMADNSTILPALANFVEKLEGQLHRAF